MVEVVVELQGNPAELQLAGMASASGHHLIRDIRVVPFDHGEHGLGADLRMMIDDDHFSVADEVCDVVVDGVMSICPGTVRGTTMMALNPSH